VLIGSYNSDAQSVQQSRQTVIRRGNQPPEKLAGSEGENGQQRAVLKIAPAPQPVVGGEKSGKLSVPEKGKQSQSKGKGLRSRNEIEEGGVREGGTRGRINQGLSWGKGGVLIAG